MVEPPFRDRPLPLFAWFEVRRAAHLRRLRLRRRAALLGVGIACLGLTIALPPLPRLVWNASASAPIGLYAVSPGAALKRGDMAVTWPPAEARQLAASRHYLPRNVPLVKRVAGIAGDMVCAVDRIVLVNGTTVAVRRNADAAGRPLPAWQGCIRLAPGMVFLLMTETPDSFDGRYFGPTSRQDVIGRATPLWLR
ncbi:S26 family signal peptidase [Sphingobium chlorophenolicum]|uniref:Conjugal transfer protein TraF n=1 Tax=Sphingobium chlorophenolicum TaxID=46429 RepID=A0A081RDK8_SPHCR|nr:S26 family signal peptidase [Sphingobium chlorophenolicum]KEQ53281.1 Conjugal transfer protein TraF [Sphingobium chlorophenolicum]